VRETTLQTPRSVKEGGGARDARAESLHLQLIMKTMVRQVVPLQPMEVHAGEDLHLQPTEGTPCCSRGMPEGGCDPVGARTGAGSCQDLRTHGERSPCQSSFAGRACDPMTHTGAACS